MRISHAQLAHFEADAERGFIATLPPHITDLYPTVADVCGPDGIDAVINGAMTAARGHGFTGKASVLAFLDMYLLLGAAFDEDPLLPFAGPHLDWDAARAAIIAAREDNPDAPVGIVSESDDPDPIDMLEGLYHDAWTWLDAVAGEKFAHVYRALARLGALLGRDDVQMPSDRVGLTAACAKVYPEKAAKIDAAAMDAFLSAAGARAKEDGLSGPDGIGLYVLWCFIGGIGAFHDPACAIDGRPPAETLPAGPERAAAHAAYVAAYVTRILASARRHAEKEG